MKNELHPVQKSLLEKYGITHQLGKLQEEMKELNHEIFNVVIYDRDFPNDDFYNEFADVKNLMQQIESELDPQRLAEMMEKKLEKDKTKYLDK